MQKFDLSTNLIFFNTVVDNFFTANRKITNKVKKTCNKVLANF